MKHTQDNVIISFRNVSKRYKLYKSDKQRFLGIILGRHIKCKTFDALSGVSFDVHRGESVGFIGKNGAGKSTLLKIITGVTFPDSGDVTVNGQVAALLELSAGFDSEMTGRENIYLKSYILGLVDEQIRKIEQDVVDFADIGDFMDQPVRMYSSGMKARLGFAINANIHPDILVIDEALSVGDAAFGEKCRQKVADVIAQGATVLFVSHAKDKLLEFCTRCILMDKGKLLMDGPTEEVLAAYDALLKKKKPAPKKA